MSKDFVAEEITIQTITCYMGSISGITILYKIIVKREQEINEYIFNSPEEVKEFLNNHTWIDF